MFIFPYSETAQKIKCSSERRTVNFDLFIQFIQLQAIKIRIGGPARPWQRFQEVVDLGIIRDGCHFPKEGKRLYAEKKSTVT